MSIKENILYMLLLPVIATTLMGGCQTKDYIREARCLRKHPIKEGYVKIDSISDFTSASSNSTSYYGHGYVVGEKNLRKSISFVGFGKTFKKGENYWREYLEENDNLIPIWYNECFHYLNIPPLEKYEVIPTIHRIYRRNLIIFFSPLVLYILFIVIDDAISRNRNNTSP